MKAKLSKDSDGYWLDISDDGITKRPLTDFGQLSLKNCQAIENGYDLDELAMGYDLYEKINFVGQMRAYKVGFQKALEILGDKKFSEKELTMLFAYGHQIGMNDVLAIQSQHSPQPMPKPDSDKLRDEFIQSLQQTEWDVEIVMDRVPADRAPNGWSEFPKLDEDGCLILKKK